MARRWWSLPMCCQIDHTGLEAYFHYTINYAKKTHQRTHSCGLEAHHTLHSWVTSLLCMLLALYKSTTYGHIILHLISTYRIFLGTTWSMSKPRQLTSFLMLPLFHCPVLAFQVCRVVIWFVHFRICTRSSLHSKFLYHLIGELQLPVPTLAEMLSFAWLKNQLSQHALLDWTTHTSKSQLQLLV